MSTARHHAEWLSLLEVSGPFLSLPVLLRAFPQGLDTLDSDKLRTIRLGYDEWRDNQGGTRPDPALTTLWIRFVLEQVLDLPREVIQEGQAIPAGLKVTIAEQGETLRPDVVVANPPGDAAAGKPRVLIQVYPPGQDLDKPVSGQRWKASPATRMMELLHAAEVRLGLVTNGERWMLVDAPRGEATGFSSWFAEYWREEPITLRAFRSLLGAGRLFGVAVGDTLEALLAESAKDQQEVTDQLGYQVRRAVAVLVQALDRADQDRGRQLLAGVGEAELYEAVLTVMMRLVFLFSAEERGLLLLGDPLYDQFYAVSTLRAQLREAADQHGEEVLERRFDAWSRLLATFRAVFGGVAHENLRLPAYGGSLFNPDRFPFLEGRRIAPPSPPLKGGEGGRGDEGGRSWRAAPADPLPINNRVILHLLEALQILQVKLRGAPAEARRLSFRALDIEQIGHVYEGLLDHTALRAGEPVLGLAGTKDKEPEVGLGELERRSDVGSRTSENFIAYLREITGRSESALRKALDEGPGPALLVPLPHTHTLTPPHTQLRIACANDDALYQRVLPFAGLLREDDFGLPMVIAAGSAYMTAGTDRRSSGTHYTPRILTEPIVQHTLEPLVYHGPAEGLPRAQWTLKSAAELLALKVCDMAMGSGAFLVQVCRYLAERLVEAWEELEKDEVRRMKDESDSSFIIHPSSLRITPEGQLSKGSPNELLIPLDPDERLAFARRIVGDRCLYGVDKNPLAVEMAKLSLWLITLDRNRPFTFLDHALKCGDSLVGADEDMFLRWAHGLKDSAATLFDETLRKQLETARAKRRELEGFEVREVRDAERKAALLAEAEAAMARVKLGCDLLIGTRLLGLKPRQVEARLSTLLMEYMANEQPTSAEAREALDAARKVRAFHWPFEFPEVFERGGFGAYLGNPPFLGGLRISTLIGDYYLQYLRIAFPSSAGTADLCAFFFLQSFGHIRDKGTLGLIATNTIAQGDTRQAGLEYLTANGAVIYFASSSLPWPGTAAVYVSIIHIVKDQAYRGPRTLNTITVANISALLDDATNIRSPERLRENSGRGFIGEYLLGKGFLLEPEEANVLLKSDRRNQDIIFPYLNGEDLNTHPEQLPSRYAINFFDWPLDKAKSYDQCFSIVYGKVYPQRQAQDDSFGKQYWWRYLRSRPEMHAAIASQARVLVVARVSKTLAFVFVPPGWIYNEKTVVLAIDRAGAFGVLQSNIHNIWVWKHSSTLKSDLNYAPSDCLETFPFPRNMRRLDSLGEDYHEYRRQLMLAQQEGLTATYNRFHDPDERSADIARLRELHVEMDQAVAAAYGWDDLGLGHGFHETPQGTRFTLSESARREVLARLLRLNQERYEEEVKAGMHEKKAGGGRQKAGSKTLEAGGGVKKRGRKKTGEGGEQLGML